MFKSADSKLYERILDERERVITVLVDEVEYLRAQLAMRGITVPGAALNPSGQPERDTSALPGMELKNYVTDEEMDVQAMLDSGEIDKSAVADVMQALGIEAEIDLDNWNLNP